MAYAWKAACRAKRLNEVPVGAALLHGQHIVAVTHNRMKAWNNPLAHAEMLALWQGMKRLRTPYLSECTLYVTLQPCSLCHEAMDKMRLKRVIFGAYDTSPPPRERSFDIIGGVQEQACGALLHSFFHPKRDQSTDQPLYALSLD